MFFSFCAPCPGSQRDKRDIRNDKVPSSSKQQSFSLRDDEEKEKEKERERERKFQRSKQTPSNRCVPRRNLIAQDNEGRLFLFVCYYFLVSTIRYRRIEIKKKRLTKKFFPIIHAKKLFRSKKNKLKYNFIFVFLQIFIFFRKEKRKGIYFTFFSSSGGQVTRSPTAQLAQQEFKGTKNR